MNKNTTPVMRQFWDAKKSHPDSIMLFRMGDFYETFENDAILTSEILGITLTKRANGNAAEVPLAGFPYHSLEQYLHKLLKAGHRVAICEQVEDPKLAKGIVRREVVEVLSPGTAMSEQYLKHNENNYLCSIIFDKKRCGISLLDNSTGEFLTCSRINFDINTFLKKYDISEVIVIESQACELNSIIDKESIFITEIPNWCNSYDTSYDMLTSFFKVSSLKGYGLDNDKLAIISASCALYYVDLNYYGRTKHITSLSLMKQDGIMGLDSYTIKNLELFKSLSNQGFHGTLIDNIDYTITAFGSRLLRNWIRQPLTDSKKINIRLNRVSDFILNQNNLEKIRNLFKDLSDIERILSRISNKKASPKEIISLGASLEVINKIKKLEFKDMKSVEKLIKNFKNTDKITKLILDTIKIDSPVNKSKGGYINSKISKELDELRLLSKDASNWMAKMQVEQQRKTNISNLKIGYNKIFGYYFEVTKSNIDKIPSNFIRKQTLINSERYFTEELKLYEEKILSAEEKICIIELQLFDQLQEKIMKVAGKLQYNAKILAELDILASFSKLAIEKEYTKPKIDQSSKLVIKNCRHPVVENLLPLGEKFIPNDIELDSSKIQIAIITGPNMAGKSTYLRQIGLIVILSHIGSYIPADNSHIGIVDKLFTRVGASDNLAGGESTFLVEMNETANILNNATSKSLILLDEIGRGTSTFDGLSIAWSVTEYIHNNKEVQAKTLFATHYHELVELANQLPRAKNLNVAVKEFGDEIVFLKKIIEGGADKSYGVYVAEMAGLPHIVIERAKELLDNYSNIQNTKVTKAVLEMKPQMNLFNEKELQFKKDLDNIDINELTPLDALKKLDHLKKKHSV